MITAGISNMSRYKHCGYKFDCGHICFKRHHINGFHSQSKCNEICLSRLCENNHRCESTCHYPEPCSPCMKLVEKARRCEHFIKISCSKNADEENCTERCTKLAPCGHLCAMKCDQECKCKEIVKSSPPCGHSPVLVQCNEQNKTEQLLYLCRERCKVILKCGHQCSGTCGECKQGRFHKRCNEKCGRILMCGHICNHPCNKNCPPCTVRCVSTCNHNSNCKHNCGSRCPPCKHKCVWRCEHLQCSMLCSEPCDRFYCERSCKKKLLCGHDCIGLCGEPCPKLCRICDKEELEDIFFGNENDPNARFVKLIDCGCTFEFEGISTYIRKRNNEIKMKSCPKCQRIIRRSYLFNTEIQSILADIELVKERTSAVSTFAKCLHMVKNTKKVAQDLITRLKSPYFNNPVSEVILKTKEVIRSQMKEIEDSRIFFLKPQLEKIKTIVDVCYMIVNLYCPQITNDVFVSTFHRRLLELLIFITNDFDNNEQQSFDLQKEVTTVLYVGKCLLLYSNSYVNQNEEFISLFSEAFDMFSKPGTLCDEKRDQIKCILNKAFKIRSGIGVSIEETFCIIKAMNFSNRGHWFKCPHNHIYCITECGGATETAVCPECKHEIGGKGHRLLESNSVAVEMDGATASAYIYASYNN